MPVVSMPEPVIRKRSRLYTQREMAKILGVGRWSVQTIEADPLRANPDTLVRYLALLGWRVGFYPRVREEGEG